MGSKERGAALVTVLLLVAAVSILAVNLNEKVRFSAQRVVNRIEHEQAYWYAKGGEALATLKLNVALQTSPADVQRLLNDSALRYPIENGEVRIRIRALQSCFNLNSLSAAEPSGVSLRRFKALGVALSLESQEFMRFTDRLLDWLDTDSQSRVQGGESSAYVKLQPGYFSQDQLLLTVAELAPIWPQSEDPGWQVLRNLLCVRSDDARQTLNPNDLDKQHGALLSALLLNRLPQAQIQTALSLRADSRYEHLDQFFSSPMAKALSLRDEEKALFSLDSHQFVAVVEVVYQKVSYVTSTVLQWRNNVLLTRYSQAGYIP